MNADPFFHIDEVSLNEYLDSALTPERRADVDAHLAICPACAAHLAEQRAVFAVLATWPDVPLERDLTGRVLTALRPQRTPLPGIVRWALVIQGGLAMVFMLVAALVLVYTLTPPDSFINPAIDSLNHLTEWLTAQGRASWDAARTTLTSALDATLAFFPESFEWMWLAGLVAVLVLWLAGNGLLLRRFIASPSRSHS